MKYQEVDWFELSQYDKFNSEIELRVSYILTEPVCPVATIQFEDDTRGAPFKVISTGTGNTIEQAIEIATIKAVERLREESRK